jgi:hypothetical protein
MLVLVPVVARAGSARNAAFTIVLVALGLTVLVLTDRYVMRVCMRLVVESLWRIQDPRALSKATDELRRTTHACHWFTAGVFALYGLYAAGLLLLRFAWPIVSPPVLLAVVLGLYPGMCVLVLRNDSSVRRRARELLVEAGVATCGTCGYDLRGQIGVRCPACATLFDAKLVAKPTGSQDDPANGASVQLLAQVHERGSEMSLAPRVPSKKGDGRA